MMGQVAPQLSPPASSAGFPANYPYAYSGPLPSAILRPLQQPLYDTEILTAVGTAAQVIFFQRQLGQSFAGAPAVVKTTAETNLAQPGQLANPLEFSVFGFLFEVEPGIVLADFNAVYTTSTFSFFYTGNRLYLEIPTTRIPQGVAPEGFSAVSTTVAATTINSTMVHNGVGHISNYYKFTIGRSALRIRPTENFQILLNFPAGATTLTTDTRLRVFILGLQWTPL